MTEYLDFLGSQAPYDALDEGDLAALAAEAELDLFPAGSVIIKAESPALDHIWVIHSGSVEVVDRGRVMDQLGPGDTFGHISLLTRLSPALSIRAREDTTCLRLKDPRTVLKHPEKLKFSHFGTLVSRERLTSNAALNRNPGSVRALMRSIIWSDAEDSSADVARRISEGGHSCALVRTPHGTGIVTDRDFRERIGSGEFSPTAPIGMLASTPALAVRGDTSQAEAFARMLDSGVHHLVVTEGASGPIGVIRTVDFASAAIRNPLRIRSAIEASTDLDSLIIAARDLKATVVELAVNGEPGLHVGNLMSAVVDAILRKIITLTPGPDLPLSWVLLGSMARREPLPRSDVDTALVWDAPLGASKSAEVRAYAESVLVSMEACGLKRCDDGANAVSPLFSRSRAEWQVAATNWMDRPAGENALLFSSIVIDSRALTDVQLGRALTGTVRSSPRSEEFLHALMLESLAIHPPSGFVRGFFVDHLRRRREAVDLKRVGLTPVASIGRWVSAVTRDTRGSTLDRLRRGAEAGVLSQDESDTLAGAFEQFYELLLERDVRALSSGASVTSSRIGMDDLDTLTRRHLRESFRSIAAIQQAIEASWSIRVKA
ncbi:putative nucleotidyltransferase substrate binding domain-containing protein [Paenarthrobacter nicotinovorans]|uniref:putative nucleotidyltransferase substrate binding domain-containing protein n=1 Tax=Paenarthrobacter nicotinovorans TaxID=29320 RepID=UPI003747BC0B